MGGFAVTALLDPEEPDPGEPIHYEVLVFVPGANDLFEVNIDATTGDILEIEKADDGEDED
jgi:uncharacterized membrane protein YkoI